MRRSHAIFVESFRCLQLTAKHARRWRPCCSN
jgi:hypothetical protein